MKKLFLKDVHKRPVAENKDEYSYRSAAEDKNYRLYVLMCMSSITQY